MQCDNIKIKTYLDEVHAIRENGEIAIQGHGRVKIYGFDSRKEFEAVFSARLDRDVVDEVRHRGEWSKTSLEKLNKAVVDKFEESFSGILQESVACCSSFKLEQQYKDSVASLYGLCSSPHVIKTLQYEIRGTSK